MSRFHSKFHSFAHHSEPTIGFPDSATDPIASQSKPFKGDFYIDGSLHLDKGLNVGGGLVVLGATELLELLVTNLEVDSLITGNISATSGNIKLTNLETQNATILDGNVNNLTFENMRGDKFRVDGDAIIGTLHTTNATFENIYTTNLEVENSTLTIHEGTFNLLYAGNSTLETLISNHINVNTLVSEGGINSTIGNISKLNSDIGNIGIVNTDSLNVSVGADIPHINVDTGDIGELRVGSISFTGGAFTFEISDAEFENIVVSKRLTTNEVTANTILSQTLSVTSSANLPSANISTLLSNKATVGDLDGDRIVSNTVKGKTIESDRFRGGHVTANNINFKDRVEQIEVWRTVEYYYPEITDIPGMDAFDLAQYLVVDNRFFTDYGVASYYTDEIFSVSGVESYRMEIESHLFFEEDTLIEVDEVERDFGNIKNAFNIESKSIKVGKTKTGSIELLDQDQEVNNYIYINIYSPDLADFIELKYEEDITSLLIESEEYFDEFGINSYYSEDDLLALSIWGELEGGLDPGETLEVAIREQLKGYFVTTKGIVDSTYIEHHEDYGYISNVVGITDTSGKQILGERLESSVYSNLPTGSDINLIVDKVNHILDALKEHGLISE